MELTPLLMTAANRQTPQTLVFGRSVECTYARIGMLVCTHACSISDVESNLQGKINA